MYDPKSNPELVKGNITNRMSQVQKKRTVVRGLSHLQAREGGGKQNLKKQLDTGRDMNVLL